jgi:hypothetical protein
MVPLAGFSLSSLDGFQVLRQSASQKNSTVHPLPILRLAFSPFLADLCGTVGQGPEIQCPVRRGWDTISLSSRQGPFVSGSRRSLCILSAGGAASLKRRRTEPCCCGRCMLVVVAQDFARSGNGRSGPPSGRDVQAEVWGSLKVRAFASKGHVWRWVSLSVSLLAPYCILFRHGCSMTAMAPPLERAHFLVWLPTRLQSRYCPLIRHRLCRGLSCSSMRVQFVVVHPSTYSVFLHNIHHVPTFKPFRRDRCPDRRRGAP